MANQLAGRLAGKTALITGGSRGIGAATAAAFAREGARVVIAARKPDELHKTAEKINADHPGAVIARPCHVGTPAAVAELYTSLDADGLAPDIVVNDAATNPYFGPLMNVEWAAWDKTFEINLKGYFEVARQAARRMMARKQPGSIVNVASIGGLRASPMQGVYGMTKAAVISMTQTLAVELAGAGIRVNAIAPGVVETKLAAVLVNTPELAKFFTERAPVGRVGQPEEIAPIMVFLAGDESSFVTGQTYAIDGGWTIT